MMFTRRLVALLMLTLPSATFAWGPEGHQIVALIAYAHLTPEAKAATKAILGDGKDIYDAEVVAWADVIRQTHKDFGPYHYVDADVSQRVIDLRRDGNNGKNVVDGLADQIAFLSGDTQARQIVPDGADGKPSGEPQTKAQALRWVVHLAGDLEQPLHTCDRHKDQGGNKVPVLLAGAQKETNLHSLWDSGMLRTYVNNFLNANRQRGANDKDPESGKEAPDITAYAMSLDAKIKPAERKAWSQGTPLDWANESHLIAVKEAYGDLPKGEPVRIDARYVMRKQQVVERQLQRGGVRLAAVLNKTFATGATSRPSR